MHSGCEHQNQILVFTGGRVFGVCTAILIFVSLYKKMFCGAFHIRASLCGGVFVGVVVSVLGRSVDALVPGADEGRGRPR